MGGGDWVPLWGFGAPIWQEGCRVCVCCGCNPITGGACCTEFAGALHAAFCPLTPHQGPTVAPHHCLPPPPCPEPRVAAGAGLRALGGGRALHVLEQGWDKPSSGNLNHRVMNRWTWEGCLPQGLGFAASEPAKCIPSWCAWPFMSAPRRAARAPPPIHEGALCRSSSRPACAAPAPPPAIVPGSAARARCRVTPGERVWARGGGPGP